jgi:alanine racemase
MTAAALLEIDLDALADNWRRLDALHDGATAGIIKADAYGLGANYVAPKLFAAGCRDFFTAHLSEAAAVRPAIPTARLAVLNGLLPGRESEFLAHDIIPVLGSLAEIALWRAEAKQQGRALHCMIHIDTGMARLGLSAAELATLAADPSLLAGLSIDYVLTHLVSAERPDDPINALQSERFTAARQIFGANQKYSFANSSGLFLGAKFRSHLARPGAAVYGINPTPARPSPVRPVVRLTARILQTHDLQPGGSVGYNGFWTARRPSRIATLGVGYADGYLRSLSNAAFALFDDTPVPLVGRVSMDLTTFDVTDTTAVAGDSLTLIGPGHDADALALEAGTNGYEILTSLGRRYQRQYRGAVTGA